MMAGAERGFAILARCALFTGYIGRLQQTQSRDLALLDCLLREPAAFLIDAAWETACEVAEPGQREAFALGLIEQWQVRSLEVGV